MDNFDPSVDGDEHESVVKDHPNLSSESITTLPIHEISPHEQDVTEYMIVEGLIDCKKRKKKLMNLSPHSFAVFKLNAIISKYCKVILINVLLIPYNYLLLTMMSLEYKKCKIVTILSDKLNSSIYLLL